MYVAYLYYFCKKTSADVKVRNPRVNLDPDRIAVYSVQADRSGGNPVVRDETRRYEDLFFARYGNSHGFDLVGDAAAGGTTYRLHFPDGSDSESFTFQNLPLVSRHIQAMRARGDVFENIVRTVSLNGGVKDTGTTLFLLQKFRVEVLLDRVVRG
jgi:hypothetical protein